MSSGLNSRFDIAKPSMTVAELNNHVVSLRGAVKKAKIYIIQKLLKQIKLYRTKKTNDEAQSQENTKRASRLLEEVNFLKESKLDRITKYCLYNTSSVAQIAANNQFDVAKKAFTRVACHKSMTVLVDKWRSAHEDWESLAAFMLSKNTGRRYKKKKKKSIEEVHVQNEGVSGQDVTTPATTINAVQTNQQGSTPATVLSDASEQSSRTSNDDNSSLEAMTTLEASCDSEGADICKITMTCNSDIVTSDLTSSTLKCQQRVEQLSKKLDKTCNPTSESMAKTESIMLANKSKSPSSIDESVLNNVDSSAGSAISKPITTISETPAISASRNEMVVKRFNLNDLETTDTNKVFDCATNISELAGHIRVKKKRERDQFFLRNEDSEDDDNDGSTDGENASRCSDDVRVGQNNASDSGSEDDDENHSPGDSAAGVRIAYPSSHNRRGSSGKSVVNKRTQNNSEGLTMQRGKDGGYDSYNRGSARGGSSLGRGRGAGRGRGGSMRKYDNRRGASDQSNEIRSKSKKVEFKPTTKPTVVEKLHPSWEASKKRKEQQQTKLVAFQGKKTKFDDD